VNTGSFRGCLATHPDPPYRGQTSLTLPKTGVGEEGETNLSLGVGERKFRSEAYEGGPGGKKDTG